VGDEQAETELVAQPCSNAQSDTGAVRAIDAADDRPVQLISAVRTHTDSVAEPRRSGYQVVAPTAADGLRRPHTGAAANTRRWGFRRKAFSASQGYVHLVKSPISFATHARSRAGRRFSIATAAAVSVALAGCGAARVELSAPEPAPVSADAALPAKKATPSRPKPTPSRPFTPPAEPRQAAKREASRDPRVVQKRLVALGYLPADTGAWDARTSHAVLAFQAWEGLARDGIVGPQTLAALENARRPTPAGTLGGRHVEVHREKGVTLLVEHGRVVRAIHSSSGAGADTTPSGSYSIFRKELNSWSVPYRAWLPYASYFNGGIAFHGYPDVPSYPASHGCVRLPVAEAPFAYAFMAIGTPVAVY
jgi:hypothetical protein